MTLRRLRWNIIAWHEHYPDVGSFAFLADACSYVVSPLHSGDSDTDGKPHWHMILQFDEIVSAAVVEDLFPSHTIMHPRPTKSLKASYRYLVHYDNPDKQQFDTEPVCFGEISPPYRWNSDKLGDKYLAWFYGLAVSGVKYSEILAIANRLGSGYLNYAMARGSVVNQLARERFESSPPSLVVPDGLVPDDFVPDDFVPDDFVPSSSSPALFSTFFGGDSCGDA